MFKASTWAFPAFLWCPEPGTKLADSPSWISLKIIQNPNSINISRKIQKNHLKESSKRIIKKNHQMQCLLMILVLILGQIVSRFYIRWESQSCGSGSQLAAQPRSCWFLYMFIHICYMFIYQAYPMVMLGMVFLYWFLYWYLPWLTMIYLHYK